MELTTHQFSELKSPLCFWPVGTIEAHDQGPLGTDVIAPEKLALDLAPDFNALVLPTLPFGLVSGLSGYPGGMWLSRQTYHNLIYELLASLKASRVSKMIIFNGHGGNTGALAEVLPRVWKEQAIKAAFIDWWSLGQKDADELFGSAGGHGGADELAVVYAANPAIVPQTWDGSRAYAVRPGVRVWPSPRSALRFGEGEAKAFTPKSAQTYYQALKERMSTAIREILDGWDAFKELEG